MEDRLRTCKWLIIIMVIVSHLSRVAPFPNGRFMAFEWGLLYNYLLTGMILLHALGFGTKFHDKKSTWKVMKLG